MPGRILVKAILNKPKPRDPWFLDDYTINPYSGCSFNCLFCYIRGSKYGTHMEVKPAIKENALEILDRQLTNRARKCEYGIIVLSYAIDPYLQFEKVERLTQRSPELLLKHLFLTSTAYAVPGTIRLYPCNSDYGLPKPDVPHLHSFPGPV